MKTKYEIAFARERVEKYNAQAFWQILAIWKFDIERQAFIHILIINTLTHKEIFEKVFEWKPFYIKLSNKFEGLYTISKLFFYNDKLFGKYELVNIKL